MRIHTTRFGSVEIEAGDVLTFAAGIFGFEHCRQWVLLADAENDCLGWLQSVEQADLALAVVSPRRFVSDYQVRVSRSELTPLQLEHAHDAHVLVVVGRNARSVTLNLKAPLLVNLQRRLGRQIVNNAETPLQHEVQEMRPPLRKSA